MATINIDSNRRCRLCLDYSSGQMVPIFEQAGTQENHIVQLLYTHLHVQVTEDQALPKHICIKCLATVEAFETFYTTVAQNQTLLVQQEESSVGMMKRNVELHSNDDLMHEERDTREESIEQTDGFQLQCVQPSEVDRLINPPSYDEAQQNKREQFITSVSILDPSSVDLSDDQCYIEKIIEESNPSDDEENNFTVSPAGGNVTTEGDAAEKDDDEENESEWEINGAIDQTDDEAGILVKVNKFKYPKMIRDGKLVVRGQCLDRCLEKFFGLTCDVCKEKISSTKELSEHYQKVHNVEHYVVCCGRKIEKRLLMAMHMAKHVQPEAFECPHCKKMMTSPRILQFHIRNHLPEAQRPLKCDLCPRRFSYVSGLLTHTSTHKSESGSNRTCHICDNCGRAYRTRARLTEHILASHSPGEGTSSCARCDVCGKQFSSRSTLSYHMTTHEPTKYQAQCEHCGKWLKNKICLRKHLLQHSDMRYQCSKCDYTTPNGQRMQSHLRVQHTDEKPYVCTECGKAFKLRSNLRNHMPQHTGERKFTCEYCSRQFVSSSNYYSHRKRMHSADMELKRKQEELEDGESRIKLKVT